MKKIRLIFAMIALLGLFSISIEKPKNEIAKTDSEMIDMLQQQVQMIELKKISEQL
jgi:hypothetical protein